MPALLTLHLVHIGHGVTIAAVRIAADLGLATRLAPQIAVTDVVIVGNAHRRAVADDVAKLQAELDPSRRVLRVAIRLITTEKQHVRVLRPQVVDDLGARPDRAAGVAAHVRDHDLILLHRIATDEALKHRLLAVAHAVGHVLRAIPALHAEMRVPARIMHLALRDFLPLAVLLLHFESRHTLLARLQREKLRAHLQHAVLLSVIRKAHHFIARHIHRRWW